MYNIPKFRRPKIFRRSLITENYENFIPNFLENFQYKANFETIEGVGTKNSEAFQKEHRLQAIVKTFLAAGNFSMGTY